MEKILFLQFAMLLLPVQVQNVLLPVSQINTSISHVLSYYPDYDIIIHFDNNTFQKMHLFVEYYQNAFQPTLVINYHKQNGLKRPVGSKFVHIVFLTNPVGFIQFSKIPFNLECNDIILIVCDGNINPKTHNLLQKKGLDQAGGIYVLNLGNNNLYYECFYCGNMSGILVKTDRDIAKYFNHFSNFYGQHFKIGYMKYLPFFWYEDSKDHNLGGPEGKLLDILSLTLNFRYSLVDFEEQMEEEWKAMINAIHHKKIDWAVGGISASIERAELVDMTKTIHTEKYRILFHCCSFDNYWDQSWRQVSLPFQLRLWISICIMLIITALCLKVINDVSPNKTSTSVLKFFEVTLRGLVDQPLHRMPIKCMTGCFILMVWWYFTIIIVTAYRSKLASSLIHPYAKQPNSIQELLADGYTFQVNNKDWSVLKENFEKSSDTVFLEVLQRSNNKLNICSSIQLAVENKVAVIDEGTNLQYEVITNCGALLSQKDLSYLRVIAQEVFPSEHVWPLQLGAPYRNTFSMMFEILFASGITSHWYSLAAKNQLPLSNHYNDIEPTISPLPIATMFAPLLILFVGLLLATVVFLCEKAYFTAHYLSVFYRQHVEVN